MTTPTLRLPRPRAATTLCAALCAGFGTAALAEPNPYYLGAVVEYGHSSNVFRAEKKNAKSDSYLSYGLVAGLDQPIGRQRIYADASVNKRNYQDVNQLDHVNYGLNAGIDWETIERLSGNLNVALNQGLEDPSLRNQALDSRVITKTQAVSFRAQYGLVSLLSLEATLAHSNTDYSLSETASPAAVAAYDALSLKRDSVGLGLKYRPSGALTLGTALRLSRGKYPNESYDGRYVDLTAIWEATGLSTLTARLSATNVGYDKDRSRDYSGLTGSLGWNYRPTGKLSFRTLLSRDTGPESLLTYGDSSRVTTGLSVGVGYEVTAKIRLNANARYIHRTLAIDGPPEREGSDRVKGLTVGVSYEPARAWLLGCNVGKESRGISGGLSTPYSVDTYSCMAQFKFQ